MHIALYSPGWPPEIMPNGIVTYVSHMRTELLRQGHSVSVFFVGESVEQFGGRIHAVTQSRIRKFKRAFSFNRSVPDVMRHGELIADCVAEVHRRDPIDVLEMEETFGWCAQVQRRFKFPVVAKLHGPVFLTRPEGAMSAAMLDARINAEGEALKRVKWITSPTRATLESTMTQYGLSSEFSSVVVNPIAAPSDLSIWSLDNANPEELLFVGRFDRIKGGDFLLIAFARLLQRRPTATLVFVGSDSGIVESDGGRVGMQEFLDRVIPPAQRAQVSYLGALRSDQLSPLRCRASVVVLCSRWENQPNTAMEAMLQGCPVVAPDVGGISEIVKNEQTGLLYEGGNVESFCNQVERVLQDRAFAQELGRSSRRYVLQAHAPVSVVKQTLDLYASIL